ncbi:MAG: response regulator [Candidatus Eremiobacteraeota bacterium]|nr:response regulator [Candidatus Eremiobacteraeota bacterium]
MRTYVIEPQTVFVSYLTNMLADAGLNVIATSDDVDARDIAAHEPAAVFIDVDFFERGAANALCRIRQTTRSAAVIVLSDADDPTFEAACYISGASSVLSKRSSVEQLIASVRGLARSTPTLVR